MSGDPFGRYRGLATAAVTACLFGEREQAEEIIDETWEDDELDPGTLALIIAELAAYLHVLYGEAVGLTCCESADVWRQLMTELAEWREPTQ